MIKIGSSYVRKFQFFEEIKDQNFPPNPKSPKNSIIINIENEEQPPENDNININNISLSDPKQMKVFENYIFINGRATHKKIGQMVRENLIMKIQNNKIIDEYFIFNLLYYDFLIKVYDFKPYFIVLGNSFCEMPSKTGTKEVFSVTKIKIYEGNGFLTDEKMEVKEGYDRGLEPFPQSLIKEIKLLKKLENEELFADEAGQDMKLFETLQNINAFDISDNFVFAAVSIDRGGIILIYGYPNLLKCDNKDIIMRNLKTITYNDKEVNVTNIKFSRVSLQENDNKLILYVATGNSIFYYLFDYDFKKNEFPTNIQLKSLAQEKLGAYNSRIQIKDSYLLIGNDKMIGEYNNLDLGQTWFFEGKKTIVNYFKNYIYFVIFGEEENSLQIFDKTNKFFVYQKSDKNKILSACNDNEFIYIFYEENSDKKYIVKIKEKSNKEKFESFFKKKYFDEAVIYAKNLNFDEEKISEISKKQAQYEFSKGHYDKSIEEYIKTIKYYEPSIVIQKFLDKSKFNFLIKYLEEIVESYTPNNMDLEECKNYTTLLLHCYIMQEEMNKLKDFIERKGEIFSKDLMKAVIDVCIETDNPDIGLSIAKQHNMVYEYLYITLAKLKEKQKAIEIMEHPEKFELKISNKEKVELYLKFADYFLIEKSQENEDENVEEKEIEDYSDKFFDSVLGFIEGNKKDLDKNDIVKLIELFMDMDKYFKILFGLMGSYNLNYSKEIIHRRIQLYLEDYELERKNKIKNNNSRLGIIEILKNKNYILKYDSQYLIMLFKANNFLEGIEIICEINKYNQDLLSIYMQQKEFEKIINICKNYGSKELSFWGTSLNYFLSKDLRKGMKPNELKKLNQYVEEFLLELLESRIMPPVDVLDMINEQNCNLPYNILNEFMKKALSNELNSIEEKENYFNDYDNKIDTTCKSIKELKTKANVFNLNKCCECGSDIDLPYYAFYCGHALHKSCINVNNKEENLECPKCKEGKKSVETEIGKYKKYQKHLISLEKVENVLEHKENKIDFIYELYGKGLFNFQNLNKEEKK